jgi:hypothetical protein
MCHKYAVRFDPMCAKALLFNTRADCFRAGLIVGKLLTIKGGRTWKTLSDSPTLNQSELQLSATCVEIRCASGVPDLEFIRRAGYTFSPVCGQPN